MAKKDKKVNAWQIIAAVFQALAALFGSLKKSHDSAEAESSSEETSHNPSATAEYKKDNPAELQTEQSRCAVFTKTARRTATKQRAMWALQTVQ